METTLNPKIWETDDKLKPEIRKALLQLTKDFIKFVKIKHLKLADISLTGSLAAYTWNDFSDLDLHIIFNLSNFERHRKFLMEYLQAKKAIWNYTHDIKIKGYKVELYPHDVTDPRDQAGDYSVIKDSWTKKPELKQEPEIDKQLIRKKYQDIVDTILWIEEKSKKSSADYKTVIDEIDAFMTKLSDKRNAALRAYGEKCIENIVFKLLRNNGFLERLSQLKTDIYDKAITVTEKQKKGV